MLFGNVIGGGWFLHPVYAPCNYFLNLGVLPLSSHLEEREREDAS